MSTQTGTNNTPEQLREKSGGKRRLFGFGKKKETDQEMDASAASALLPTSPPQSPPIIGTEVSASPGRTARIPHLSPAPERYRSASPRMTSPTSSQIFERNVQESTLSGELSPAIPSHIQTEEHIPPVLEAASLAITDSLLNPDEVEIVSHAAHQPAAAAVSGAHPHESTPMLSAHPDNAPISEMTGISGPNYGSIDTADPRRLSFISFADVVQGEHVENDRDAAMLASLASITNRSPSPIRSPASSHLPSPSPPTSVSPSIQGLDTAFKSPTSPTGLPGTHSPPLSNSGELTIETMRQALRKTGSGDLGGVRSAPMSPVSLEDSQTSQAPLR